jgi:hypothetical protein
MRNILNAFNLILFVICYVILIIPALIILVIADAVKENRFIKLLDYNIMQKFEG